MKALGWICLATGALILIASSPMIGAGISFVVLGNVLLYRAA